MSIVFSTTPPTDVDTVAIAISDSLKLGEIASSINQSLGGVVESAIQDSDFKAKSGKTLVIQPLPGGLYKRVILFGMGEEKELTDKSLRDAAGALIPVLESNKAKRSAVIMDAVSEETLVAHAALGMRLRQYRFEKYKTKKDEDDLPALESISIVAPKSAEAEAIYHSLQAVADGVYLARDVVTEPPNKLYPESYANIIKKELTEAGATVKILSANKLEKLGMGALLGVGQGSIRESHVVIIEWNGNPDSKEYPLALVGKGVTFDTGGISLKPSNGMEDMKYDMGGSASVVGTMRALAGRKAKVNAVGIVGLVENMPSHNAQRPSDVVTSMSGQTIEVLNTDAEGRLVLADVLWYIQEEYKPKYVIDLATLTGAIVIALGEEHAGIFSNSDDLSEKVTASGLATGERVWRFPLDKAYDKMLDSPIADMQNISSGRGAGSITAAQFLQRFIKEGVEWMHIDIAGVAWAKKDLDSCPKGARGYGVQLLDHMVKNYFEA